MILICSYQMYYRRKILYQHEDIVIARFGQSPNAAASSTKYISRNPFNAQFNSRASQDVGRNPALCTPAG